MLWVTYPSFSTNWCTEVLVSTVTSWKPATLNKSCYKLGMFMKSTDIWHEGLHSAGKSMKSQKNKFLSLCLIIPEILYVLWWILITVVGKRKIQNILIMSWKLEHILSPQTGCKISLWITNIIYSPFLH